ncbi:hypothetical protein [Macrococcus equi]|uniref:hypothetical protein n=1 Tax=Macrococcus equi TaxID=3395462 RepID=UPI0039BEBAB6
MKKIIFLIMATIISIVFLNDFRISEAKSYSINFSNPKVAKNMLAGKVSYKGIRFGENFAKLNRTKKYEYYDTSAGISQQGAKKSRYDKVYPANQVPNKIYVTGYADFQSKMTFNQKKINRIFFIIEDADKYGKKYSRNYLLKVYKKPISTINTYSDHGSPEIVDVYKSVVLVYSTDIKHNRNKAKLSFVQVVKYNSKSELTKFKKLLKHSGIPNPIK